MNRVEQNVANGETAHNEQFLLLLQCFQKSSDAGFFSKNCVYLWEWANQNEIKTERLIAFVLTNHMIPMSSESSSIYQDFLLQ